MVTIKIQFRLTYVFEISSDAHRIRQIHSNAQILCIVQALEQQRP